MNAALKHNFWFGKIDAAIEGLVNSTADAGPIIRVTAGTARSSAADDPQSKAAAFELWRIHIPAIGICLDIVHVLHLQCFLLTGIGQV